MFDRERAAKERSLAVVMAGLRGLADLPPAPQPLGTGTGLRWTDCPPWWASIRPSSDAAFDQRNTSTVAFPKGLTDRQRRDVEEWLRAYPHTPMAWRISWEAGHPSVTVELCSASVAADLLRALDEANHG